MQLFADTDPDAVTQRITESDTHRDSNSHCDSNRYCHRNRNTNSNRNTIPDPAVFCRSGHSHCDSRTHRPNRLSNRCAGVFCH